MKTCLVLAMSLTLLAAAHAAPIILEMTLDTERHGTAVISGTIDVGQFPPIDLLGPRSNWSGGYFISTELEFAKVGVNWNVWGDLTWEAYFTDAEVYVDSAYDLHLYGQHMVPPDPGEAKNGLPMEVFYDNLGGSTIAVNSVPDSDIFDTYPHLAGSHADTMTLKVADLNGNAPGVFSATKNFAASVELYHVPDRGSTLLWWGAGCAGAAWLSRRRRYRAI